MATVPREALADGADPQGFPFAPLLAAHRKGVCGRARRPDQSRRGCRTGRSIGARRRRPRGNMKLTTRQTFPPAEACSRWRWKRAPARGSMCIIRARRQRLALRVKIPHDRGLVGHSDADVGLHALTDALLGTIGDGDIGEHFPPSDPKWRGAPPTASWPTRCGASTTTADASSTRRDTRLRAPEDSPHRDADAGADRRIAGIESGPRRREGDDQREDGLHRPRRRDRGHGHCHSRVSAGR